MPSCTWRREPGFAHLSLSRNFITTTNVTGTLHLLDAARAARNRAPHFWVEFVRLRNLQKGPVSEDFHLTQHQSLCGDQNAGEFLAPLFRTSTKST